MRKCCIKDCLSCDLDIERSFFEYIIDSSFGIKICNNLYASMIIMNILPL